MELPEIVANITRPYWQRNEDFRFSSAMKLVLRNSFPNLSNFQSYFTQLGKFQGGGQFRKVCRSREKESKQSEIT